MTSLISLAQPIQEPVTLDDVKTHLRVEHSDDDASLLNLITTARIAIETFTRRSLIEQSFQLVLNRWPLGPLRLPKPPLIAVDAVRVVDDAGVAQALDPSFYRVETRAEPGFLLSAPGMNLPRPMVDKAGIEVDFRAGYGADPQLVPAPLTQAHLILITQLYERRSEAAPLIEGAAHALLQPFRMPCL